MTAMLEKRDKELRKIALKLRQLADDLERAERHVGQRKGRNIIKASRQWRSDRAATDLLLSTAKVGGPQDEQLRLIVLSWHASRHAWRCFYHVCKVWRPLQEQQVIPDQGNVLQRARALRVIAEGVYPDASSL